MNERAFEEMAPRLQRRAMETSRSYGATQMEAEDVAQDVLLRLWQMHDELDRFRSLEAVATTMARWATLNLRRRKPMTGLQDNRSILWLKTDSSPERQLEEQEDEQWLQNRLAELPSTQHAILVMRQVERRSSQEIARLLCITEASVRTLLARARHTLFEELKKRKQ